MTSSTTASSSAAAATSSSSAKGVSTDAGPTKSRYATTALGSGAAGRTGRPARQAAASGGDENGKATRSRQAAKYATMPAKTPKVGASLVGHGGRRDAPLPRVALLAQAKANKRTEDHAH